MPDDPVDADSVGDAERDETDATGREPTDDADGLAANDAETVPPGRATAATDDDPSPAALTTTDGDVDLDAPGYYLNRELSELAFQERVLFEAVDPRNPLLERVKFLAIFTQNMDEFFMKRVGGLKQQIDADVTELTPDGRTPKEQWGAVHEKAHGMLRRQAEVYHDGIRELLAEAGIAVVDHDDLSADERDSLREYFENSILPTLTPLTFDPAHPFPFISNLSLSLAVLTRDDADEDPKFSRVKIPKNRPRLVRVDDDGDDDEARFVRIEDVVEANLDLLFPNVEVLETATFRVTRNAEVRRNEEVAEGLIDMIEDVLRQRRFATVVRLEVAEDMPAAVRDLLTEQLGVEDEELYELPEPLDFRDFVDLVNLDRPDLSIEEWTPKAHPRFAGLDPDVPSRVFEEIRRDDILVHHPYHSFTTTVQSFIDAAANDPDVLAIKAAIYRTADDSNVIESLIEAAQNGKQVAVMVELKARFDEENNLRWVKRLEEEGIHVAYGTIGLKTHSKTALVVREEDDGVRLYSHVATGNYHSETAKTYADLGLLTADRDVGQDLVRLFNYFTGHSLHEEYRKLLVAPTNMRRRFTDLVRREADHARAGDDARIVAKMNALEDPRMVRELYEASMAGVDIDLVVRGICRFRPGIEGVSDSASVHSVVGRFLEHSRIFYFGNGGDGEYYVGSADWMTRNLDRRVEAVTPVEDPDLCAELQTVLDVMLSDNRKRWAMRADGTYEQVRPAPDEDVRDTHRRLMARARVAVPNGIDFESETRTTRTRRDSDVDFDTFLDGDEG